MSDTGRVKVAIIGAGGYSGAELIEILLGHGQVEIVGLFGSSRRLDAGEQRLAESWGRFRGMLDLPVRGMREEGGEDDIAATGARVVFLATPHEASLELAPRLLAKGLIVIDLSGAYRLKDAGLYPVHYGFEHTHRSWLEKAQFGLPELFRDKIADADLIAAPGCYPTSAIVPLAPLVRAGAIAKGADGKLLRPIVDSASGVSGAGRSPVVKSLFCEVSLQAYNVFKHRHAPEIEAYAGTRVIFTPHLVAFDRGILSTIHVELAEGWDAARVAQAYQNAYGEEPFVRLCPQGTFPAVADVRHSNFCDIGWMVEPGGRHLIIESALDNLVKGAAGQAVQCMNCRMGLNEREGLLRGGSGS